MAKIFRYWAGGILLGFLICCLPAIYAQEEVQLHLVAVDTGSFPIVTLTLLTADSRSAPADLSDLSVHENGVAITDLTFDHVPVGVDVTFVLDANAGFGAIDDDSGLTRREETANSVRRFAESYMNPDGLDTVSIVVPDEEGQSGQFLIRGVDTAKEVITALEAYDPQRLGPTALNAMIAMGLEEAQGRKDNGRYQALLLISDGRRLDQQLSFLQLVAQANDANVPIYSAILGESADDHEISNVSRLSEPTRAFYVHLADSTAADPIYQIWQDQSSPVQVEYRSNQRQSGRNQLTLNLGSALVSSSFDLTLLGPNVSLFLENSEITRAGTAPDTLLNALQPTVQPVTLTIEWPDGLARQISEVSLIVDGQEISADWETAAPGQILFNWDISYQEAGTVELAAEITDELGYKGTTAAIPVNFTIERPLPPAPVPVAENEEPEPQIVATEWMRWELLAGTVLVLVLIAAFFVRRRRKKTIAAVIETTQGPTVGSAEPIADDMLLVASLEPFGGGAGEVFLIEGGNVAIGSEAQKVQIFLNDSSVNRLHARIRKQNQDYWLFDEGSFEGTYLNYERLGLAPQPLSDGDAVQFGKAQFRFRLRQELNQER